jgi:hypothetical protein
MFPENIVAASFQQVQSEYEFRSEKSIASNMTEAIPRLKRSFTPGMNVLGKSH